MAFAPHCAVRAMLQCAEDQKDKYPLAAAVVMWYFYMDECLAGVGRGAGAAGEVTA